jgi:hypothetical protein
MTPCARPAGAAAVVVMLLLALGATAGAAQLRYHYVPADAYGNTRLQPAGPGGVEGEYQTWLGLVSQPAPAQPRPTHLVTFRHPCTGGTITVPIRFPEGTPRLEYRPNRIVYNYGSYTVEAHFLPDGSMNIIYNSGLLRAP